MRLNRPDSLHVAMVPFVGFRIGEARMLELGMALPGLRARADAIAQLPALGLLTLAGMTPAHWEVSYHEVDGDDVESLTHQVMRRRPNVVAVSALTASVESAYRFMDLVRQQGVPVVFGGLHATTCPDEAEQYCDAVVIGEGEPVWIKVLDDVEHGCLRRRYKAEKPFDLAEAPVPRTELLSCRARPRFTLQTQRGCPLACDFCGASRLLGGFREKPINRVADELAAIRANDQRPTVELADDNTFAGRRDPRELFDVLKGVNVRYFTESDWRIGERPEVLEGLADSGCVQVLVGIESLVSRHAGMGAKRATNERVMRAVEKIQQAGVAVIGCFILGADGETRESIDDLVRFLESCPLADVQLTVQTPFPGTALYRQLLSHGRLRPECGWRHFSLFDVTYQPDGMSAVELQDAFHAAVREVFSPVNTQRRNEIRRAIWANRFQEQSCES